MDKSEYGVHAGHCCVMHGCAYYKQDCPVVNGEVKQEYPCMDCPSKEEMDELRERLAAMEAEVARLKEMGLEQPEYRGW